MGMGGWHGCSWARHTEGGACEIRAVPSSLGEPSAHARTFLEEGFEKHFENVDR
jgi:hypothetical protein